MITTNLNEKEQRAYAATVENNMPKVGTELQAQLFGLYLTGASCEEIQKLKPGLSLGQIVRCRVEYNWDTQLEEYRTRLLEGVKDSAMQAQLESIETVSLMIMAFNRFYKDKIKKYILTGDEEELVGLPVTNLTIFKGNIELLQKLTGQENTKKVEVNTTTNQTLTVKGALSPDKAARLLELLDDDETE